jgi:hypothetical protein
VFRGPQVRVPHFAHLCAKVGFHGHMQQSLFADLCRTTRKDSRCLKVESDPNRLATGSYVPLTTYLYPATMPRNK